MKSLKILAVLFCALLFLGERVSAQEIRSGSSLAITISGVPQEETSRFNTAKFPVSNGGTVSMPFIGSVRAVGLTGDQLARSLEAAYKKAGIYTMPTFNVSDGTIIDITQLTVVVGGQVRRPGPMPYNRTLTLYDAVQTAGGATEFGSMKRVTLFRNGKSKDYDLTKGQFMTIPLEPNDTVEVPQKTILGN
ncbi:MAG: polysaccharide biosynthesis/export family protein [Verrucomicrobiota bacterium]